MSIHHDYGLRLLRAFEFVALLLGRDWTTVHEIAAELGIHKRTAHRYVEGAFAAGLIEVRRGTRINDGNEPTRIRLLGEKLRRKCAA